MSLEPGDRLAQYEIVTPLAAGGMGEVFVAKDPRLQRQVAIKILPRRLADDREALARFEREAQVVASLSHPNILAIHDFGAEGGVTYAVMELLEGENLRRRMRSVSLSPRKVIEISTQIARGLAAAHARGVIHRDLKPENIFLTHDGQIKILDFGLAKKTPIDTQSEVGTQMATVGLTEVGTIAGTVAYMSPEQLRGAQVDHRSDLFSFGTVLYELLAGTRPFSGDSTPEVMGAILRDAPPALSESGVFVSPALQRILHRCLEKLPDDRFQSATDLAFALEAMSDIQRDTDTSSGLERSATIAGDERPYSSIAVLPFSNMSTDPEQEFFCEGMAEEIINALSRIEDLRVAARASAFQFKGTAKDIREIGGRLDVQTVLDGSVRSAGKRLRITVQLVEVGSGFQIWSERYDRELEDVFAIQDEISESIVEALQKTLGGEGGQRAGSRHSDSIVAYRLYLKGRHNWYKREKESLQKAVQFFEGAVREDPEYALAWAAISNAYVSLNYYASDPEICRQKAEEAIAKAVSIDPTLPEVQAAVGFKEVFIGWNWEQGEASLRGAIEANRTLVLAHSWYAFILMTVGRFEEADSIARQAIEIDPLSVYARTTLGVVKTAAGDFTEAVRILEDARELDADFLYMLWALGAAYGGAGMPEQAVKLLERAAVISERGTYYVSWLGWGYGLAGRTDDARQVLDELSRRSQHEYVAPLCQAQVYSGLGDLDRGLEWWQRAIESNNGAALFSANLSLRPLVGDARGRALLSKLGIPQSSS